MKVSVFLPPYLLCEGTNISPPPPHHANVCTFSTLCLPGSYIFVRLRRVTFKFGNFTNFKALFQVVSTDFPSLVHVKSCKTAEGSFIFGIHVDYMHDQVYKKKLLEKTAI